MQLVNTSTHYYDEQLLKDEMNVSLMAYRAANAKRMDGPRWPMTEYRVWDKLSELALTDYARLRDQLEWQQEHPEQEQHHVRVQ